MYKTLFSSLILCFPVHTYAQFGEIDTFFANLSGFIGNTLIPFIFSLALLVFLFGMYRYFIQGGASEEQRAKGKQLILWSIVAFVLMVSIWGIVNVLSEGLFGEFDDTIDPPGTLEMGGAPEAPATE